MIKERQFIFLEKKYIDMWKFFDRKSLDDIKLELQCIEARLEADLKKGYRLEFSVYECGYDGGQELYINLFRPETDREMKKRIEHEEEAERELYEKLKMKFESA